MGDSLFDKMSKVSAKEIAQAVGGKSTLSPEQQAAADVNDDGRLDASDAELMADAQIKLANKISGAIVGMEGLSQDEKKVADRNGDQYINLTDSYRLADDARAAKRETAQLKHSKE